MSLVTIEDLIERRPEVCGGEPVARGTRVPVQVLTDLIRGGTSAETICSEYPSVDPRLVRFLALTAPAAR